MNTDTLNVIIEQAESNWCAYTPDDIGVIVVTGQTRDETVENFRQALKSHLELMQDQGLTAPEIHHLNIQELAPV